MTVIKVMLDPTRLQAPPGRLLPWLQTLGLLQTRLGVPQFVLQQPGEVLPVVGLSVVLKTGHRSVGDSLSYGPGEDVAARALAGVAGLQRHELELLSEDLSLLL
jgi:hypothetical protein